MGMNLIKAGGGELSTESLPILGQYLQCASAKKDAQTVFIFGGGPQIDRHWKLKHAEPRPKLNGVGITSQEVLEDAVLPAYAEIRSSLQKIIPHLKILDPQQLVCDRNVKLGFVGDVKDIEGIIPHEDVGIGFVGVDGLSELNVNADTIVSALVDTYRSSLQEVILLTSSGGILDRTGERISELSSAEIDSILHNEHPSVVAADGMRKKLEEVKIMLTHVQEVLMMKTHELLKKDSERTGTRCYGRPCL